MNRVHGRCAVIGIVAWCAVASIGTCGAEPTADYSPNRLPVLAGKPGIHATGNFSRYLVEVSTAGVVRVFPKSNAGAGGAFVAGRLEYRRYDKGRRKVVVPAVREFLDAAPATSKLQSLVVAGVYDDGTPFRVRYRFLGEGLEIEVPVSLRTPPGQTLTNDFHLPKEPTGQWGGARMDYESRVEGPPVRLSRDAQIAVRPIDRRHESAKLKYHSRPDRELPPLKEASVRGPWGTTQIFFTPDRDSEIRILQQPSAKSFLDGYSLKVPLSGKQGDGKTRPRPQVLKIRIR